LKVVAAVIIEKGRILLCRRPEGAQDAGRWEFPGGKVKKGETPQSALTRELMEELALVARPVRRLAVIDTVKPGGKAIRLQFFLAVVKSGEPRPMERQQVAWVVPDKLMEYDLCAPDRRMAAELLDRKSGYFYPLLSLI